MKYEIYNGNDLGAVYTKDSTTFRVWTPTAQQVQLCLYKEGNGGTAFETIEMQKDVNGTWFYKKEGDLHKVYYTYLVEMDGTVQETNDPYAKAAGVNGKRSMVVDLTLTNPEGFDADKGPSVQKETDIVVYEISIADTTADKSSGVHYAGKYLGLTERGTQTKSGIKTAFDHILELGVTHVQIMPCYDFGSIDESRTDIEQYNWGYDPINYNVPEGSYSTDAFHGEVRIKELKQMIQTFHKHGIGVIMDVVYNHTYDVASNCFQKCVPDYYYRKDENGYSNASGCGNEIATERPMVSKFILDSLKYWMNEYHMDGFRFDLMGCMDIETMEQIAVELRKDNPSVILYGEGWSAGSSVLPEEKRCLKSNIPNFNGFGAFSDDIRDAIKGSVFCEKGLGFVNGAKEMEDDLRYSIAGATFHPQVNYEECTYSQKPWAKNPTEVVNYVSCHDNLTLWDKLTLSRPDTSKEERLAMNRLCASIVFTSQGIPFFLSGEEFARTKPIESTDKVSENSYNLPLYTNSIKYERLEEYKELYEFYKGLIAFRKSKELLRLGTNEEVVKCLKFIENLPQNVVAFVLEDENEKMFVVYNANEESVTLDLPNDESWEIYIDDNKASNEVLYTVKGNVEVKRISCLVGVFSPRK